MPSKILQCLVALFALCIELVVADSDISIKAAYQHYAITGVHTGINSVTGARPARQPIQVMQKDPITFALYIQSLGAMQSASQSDVTSWYQFAGIHGRPYMVWDDVPQAKGAPTTGYCTHDSVLFPTWHRPLLAGLEQILSGHCQTIAATYPAAVRAQYVAACNNFRLPYWDWASNATIPDIVNSPTVTINTPSGSQTLANPLWTYKFPALNPSYFPTSQNAAGDWYLAKDSQTYRCPNTEIGGPSNIAQANAYLQSSGLQYSTYYALTKATSYNVFATQALQGPSIESVHGTVHVDVGGNYGHMTQLSYAGFDPIFYLHHCNVDRIVALYQAMNPVTPQTPGNYLTSGLSEGYGTFTLAVGTPDTLTTPLEPFSTDTNGDSWTSASSQNLSAFGYTYPEIQDWNQSPTQLAQNVTAQVNTLYSGQTTPSKRSVTIDGHQQVIEWSVALSVSKYEMNGRSFIVRLFVGGVPADPTTWAVSNSCVGSFSVLTAPQIPTGPLLNLKSYDEISLVQALRSIGNDGQDVPSVVDYLTNNFEWRVQLINGTVAREDQYQTLTVEVQEEIVTLGRNIYELPSYGAKTMHPEITQGKAGGYLHKKKL